MASDGQALVQVRDLYKSFTRGSEEIRVLQKLTLDVPAGEFLALMGPSGSGKTTLLNLIAGLDSPTGGDIYVAGEHVSAMSESELARWRTRSVGFVFQFYYLLPVLTAYENVELPLLLLPMTKEQRRKQVMTALDLVKLGDRTNHRPSMLSGGQQQRVGIARAMVTDPALIVADEPTGDLDSKSADEILNIMEVLCRQLNKTIIMVTHDPHAAERAMRTLHLEKGRLVLDDSRTSQLAERQKAPAFSGDRP
jgi:putative ABC transport system ATP-binding protein